MAEYPKIETEVIQLLSNDHLALWINKFGYLIKIYEKEKLKERRNPKKISLITDMKRGEMLEEGV